jgi:hypothetical protein
VAVYYARKMTAADIEVVGLPAPFGADFFYLEETHARPDMHAVKRYPLAGSILVKAAGTP